MKKFNPYPESRVKINQVIRILHHNFNGAKFDSIFSWNNVKKVILDNKISISTITVTRHKDVCRDIYNALPVRKAGILFEEALSERKKESIKEDFYPSEVTLSFNGKSLLYVIKKGLNEEIPCGDSSTQDGVVINQSREVKVNYDGILDLTDPSNPIIKRGKYKGCNISDRVSILDKFRSLSWFCTWSAARISPSEMNKYPDYKDKDKEVKIFTKVIENIKILKAAGLIGNVNRLL